MPIHFVTGRRVIRVITPGTPEDTLLHLPVTNPTAYVECTLPFDSWQMKVLDSWRPGRPVDEPVTPARQQTGGICTQSVRHHRDSTGQRVRSGQSFTDDDQCDGPPTLRPHASLTPRLSACRGHAAEAGGKGIACDR